MKFLTLFITASFGFCMIAPLADARGERARAAAAQHRGGGGGGGGGANQARARAAAAQRNGGARPSADRARAAAAQRSPMTHSKIQRPRPGSEQTAVSRPQNLPTRPAATRPVTRPVERPTVQRPTTLPQGRPTNLPDRRPEIQPGNRLPQGRPTTLPDRRPEIQPGNRLPGSLPPGMNRPGGERPNINRPDGRPSLERPNVNRPNTLPGMVTYPNRPGNNRPNLPNLGGNDRPNLGNINLGNQNRVNIGNVNIDRRNIGLNRPSTLPADRRNWDRNQWGGNRSVWGNRVNIGNNVTINHNFYRNHNFAFRPHFWGAHPWWGAGSSFSWHHGHWSFGWNSGFYRRHWWAADRSFASGFMWGISVWSLGNLIYDMGYQTYRNPYPAPVVHHTFITYKQPISVAAAENPPGNDETAELAEAKSAEALERSRAAFKQGDFLTAHQAVDEALTHTPGDVTLHEYRALVLFALGKYADAAGVLHPVLASGPGWSWETMIGFYNNSETYSEQLHQLESYVKKSPDRADARFLLGYHYMVCGHMEMAYQEFSKASELQPADTISRQLRDLTKASIPDHGESDIEREAQPKLIPADQLVGVWVSDRGEDGKVTFTMTEAGDYTWNFMNAGKTSELKGTFGLDDQGLLILSSEDTQMVSAVELKADSTLHFALIGAPDGDPGLMFVRK